MSPLTSRDHVFLVRQSDISRRVFNPRPSCAKKRGKPQRPRSLSSPIWVRHALLSRLHPKEGDFSEVVEAICDQAMLRRDPAAAITLLRTWTKPPNSLPPRSQAYYNLRLGELEQLSGNANEARTSFTEAREALEKELKQQPQNLNTISNLALTLAGRGEREAALREADRAVELVPSSHNARTGPSIEEMRARIQARFGDGDRAIPTLKHLLEIPYAGALTPALLRLHPDL